MGQYKLHLCSILIILYISFIYAKDTTGKDRIKCHPIFDAFLYVAPWAVLFDGLSYYTVNHLTIVPNLVNVIVHLLFFELMNAILVITFIYMLDITVGFKRKHSFAYSLIPGVIFAILIVAFIPQLKFLSGDASNYSMGVSVYLCFGSLVLHYAFIILLLIFRGHYIEKRKQVSIIIMIIVSFGLLIIQATIPDALVSASMPALILVGLYITTENPSIRRLHHYNQEMITGFATLVENRDSSTGGHIRRTRNYVTIILEEMRNDPKYYYIVTKDFMRNVINAAPMHDIGKIATPDHILQKPGKLTDEEYDIMKQHAAKGGDIIKETFRNLDDPEYVKIAYEVARYHHEKWNGRGYPEGLKGTEIPLHARIMAIADVFDAVSAKRCYRDAMPIDTCFKIIEEGKGTDFDPELAQMFLDARERVLEEYNTKI